MTPGEFWAIYLLGTGTGLLLARLFRWLRAHERAATVPEWQRRRDAMRRATAPHYVKVDRLPCAAFVKPAPKGCHR